ncbi:MAG: HD domain-containing protein, partial [Euryarchaeota archaeon]|nr:HD domain-containing protein [Euryarchaeota archaeon]
MSGFKVVHDGVHGSVRLEGVFLDLLERPEMQRLHGVHQLGLAHLVFPGANHTRLEHSLGTYHIAGKLAEALRLPEGERNIVLAAALLHDLGHPPFSHTLEAVLKDRLGISHMEVTRSIILGESAAISDAVWEVLGGVESISDLLERAGISPEMVGDIIASPLASGAFGQSQLEVEGTQAHFGGRDYLRQIIHGPVDADQMDYLLRDAHYTGVAHGTIDIDRLLQTISVFHGDLVVDKGGVVAVEGLLVARALMYTSVYFHKTVRIAEMMLCKAAELADKSVLEDIQVDTDFSFAGKLIAAGGDSKRIMTMLQYRRLYKRAFSINIGELEEEQVSSLLDLTDYGRRKEAEARIAERAGISQADVIVDVPEKELLISEPRIGKTEVPILNGDRVRPLSKYSPLAKALQARSVHDWAVMVSCAPAARETI